MCKDDDVLSFGLNLLLSLAARSDSSREHGPKRHAISQVAPAKHPLAQHKTHKKKKDGKIKPQKSGLAHLLLLKTHIINLIHLSKRQSINNLNLRWNTPAVHLILSISN